MPPQWWAIMRQHFCSAGVNWASGAMHAMAEGPSRSVSTKSDMARRAKLIATSLRQFEAQNMPITEASLRIGYLSR